MKESWIEKDITTTIIAGFVIITLNFAIAIITGAFVYFLWNWLLSKIFDCTEILFWQALVGTFLIQSIFTGITINKIVQQKKNKTESDTLANNTDEANAL